MTNDLPDPDLEGADAQPNPTLRVLGRVLLVAAGGPALGVLMMRVAGDGNVMFSMAIILTLLCVLVLPLVCLVLAIAAYMRGQKDVGLGYLLATFAVPIVGFGTCLGSLAVTGL